MDQDKRDRELGMDRPITRRDFLNGASIAIGASLLSPGTFWTDVLADEAVYAPEKAPGYYPPAKTGMRGSHDGSWEVAHSLRDGKHWDNAAPDTESYDLIVVGGGISGLSAAYFYRQQAGPKARVLILENHDDFGGHAKRNEFQRRRTVVYRIRWNAIHCRPPPVQSRSERGSSKSWALRWTGSRSISIKSFSLNARNEPRLFLR